MKKRNLDWIGYVVLIFLVVICLYKVLTNNYQAMMSIPLELELQGEYSFDNENWFTLDENSDLSTKKGNLYVRGHFNEEIFADTMLNMYCNHIGITLFVNNEMIFMNTQSEFINSDKDVMRSMCGRYWEAFLCPEITKEDEVSIHFQNVHKYGDEKAFHDALYTIYATPNDNEVLENHLNSHVQPIKIIGGCISIIAMMLLGAFLLAIVLKSDVKKKLFYMGITTLFVGGYIYFDTMMIYITDGLLALQTYGRQLCMMLAAFFGCTMICMYLNGIRKQIGTIIVRISFVIDVLLLCATIWGDVLIYDTQHIWKSFQFLICIGLGVCLLMQIIYCKKAKQMELYCFVILMSAMLLDLLGFGKIQYHSGLFSKISFVVVLIIYFIRSAIKILQEYHASVNNEKLQEELENSRIAIMLSQIQPHFLYNAIGSIRGVCRIDAEYAWRALGDFANYLRGNMNALSNKNMIHFSMELKHIEAYLRLEKMRMGERLQVEYDILEKDFYLPPLTIQPLVENAIKHGLFEKEEVGTLRLSSKKVEDGICIVVEDDGVGFNSLSSTESDEHHTHIGLINVQKRVEKMSKGKMIVESELGKGTKITVILHNTEREMDYEHISNR